MKRIPTISKPMTIVLNKSTNPARQIIPDIIKLNELTNSIVVLGINFGLSETTNRYPKLIRTAMQHEIDEYHDGNSNRGSCTDTEKEDKESEQGKKTNLTNDSKDEDMSIAFVRSIGSSHTGASDLKHENTNSFLMKTEDNSTIMDSRVTLLQDVI